MLEHVADRAKRAISEKTFPGCVIGVVSKSGKREVRAFGKHTYDARSPEVEPDTVYDLASITKSIPTASLAATFISQNKLSLSDKVTHYIPELQNDYGANIEDLLRYRVQGPQLSKLPFATFEEIRTHVFEQGFTAAPGVAVYTNLPAFVLGVILERTSGKSIHALAHEYFFSPLGMENTTFFPAPSICAPTEIDERGEVRGLPHDESAYRFAAKRRSVGHAGLFSTAPDLLNFLDAMLEGKLPHVVDAAQRGLGWQVHDSNFMGPQTGPLTFGKTGFTGTSIVCDLKRGVGCVILSNRTYPKRPADSAAINAFRRDVTDTLFENTAE